jgi:hypothetical protein
MPLLRRFKAKKEASPPPSDETVNEESTVESVQKLKDEVEQLKTVSTPYSPPPTLNELVTEPEEFLFQCKTCNIYGRTCVLVCSTFTRCSPWYSAVGTALAVAFIEPSDVHDLHAHMAGLAGQYDINLPNVGGVDFSRLAVEWSRFKNSIPDPWKFSNDGREFEVGERMKARGLTAQYPVVLIPGVISTVFLSIFHERLTYNWDRSF